jgi:hypothetical protein
MVERDPTGGQAASAKAHLRPFCIEFQKKLAIACMSRIVSFAKATCGSDGGPQTRSCNAGGFCFSPAQLKSSLPIRVDDRLH